MPSAIQKLSTSPVLLVAGFLCFQAGLAAQSYSATFNFYFHGDATAAYPGTLTGSGQGSVEPIGGDATLQILGTENDSSMVLADLTITLQTGDQLKLVFSAQDSGPPDLKGTAGIAGGSGFFTGASGTLSVTLHAGKATDAGDYFAFPFSMDATGTIVLPYGTTGPLAPPNLQPTSGVSCSDPVSVNNGNLYQSRVDLALSGRGPGLAVVRSYNSLLASMNGPFGYGWTHNFNMSLKDVQTAVTWINGSGAAFAFSLQGSAYTPPPGVRLALAKDSQGYTLRNPHGTQSRFDSKGVLSSIADRNQNGVTMTYDSSGRLTTVTDALGHALTLTYDAGGHITQARDFSGRQVSYAYDGAGNLISATDAAGNVTRYSYYQTQAQQHLLQTVTTPAGNITTFAYGQGGQVSSVSDSGGRNMSFQYTPASSQTAFTDPRGFKATYSYDSLGNVTRVLNPDGSHADTAYSPDGRIISQTDETGATTHFTYDPQGNVASVTDATEAVITLTYEPVYNQVTSAADARGAVTRFQYDAHGNLTQVVRPLGVILSFTYDSFGDLLTATDGEGNTRRIAYDGSGNPVKVTDALGNSTQFQFDNLRRVTGIVDALNGVQSLQWDALDRVIRATDPLGNSRGRSFDANGNLAQTTDGNGHTTTYSYDALDNLSAVTDAAGAMAQYGYAAPNCGCSTGSDLVLFRDGAGVNHTQQYDYAERLTQSADAAGNQVTFAYNARGDLTGKTDANGAAILYEYDAAGRLTHKSFPDGTDARFVYDRNGNLVSATNANASISFDYDALNRVRSTTDSRFHQGPHGSFPVATLRYTYDRNGRRLSVSEPGRDRIRTNYQYDAGGRLTAVSQLNGAGVQFTYDILNRPASIQYSNGAKGSWQYDAAGQVTSIVYAAGASPIAQFTYTYDKNGNPSTMNDAAGSHRYQFDAVNRLTGAAPATGSAESFGYDGAGNRTSSASDPKYAYDPAGRLVAAEGVTYTYDKAGRLIQRTDTNGTTKYSYDFENHLIAITLPNGAPVSYLYDALGRRIQKSVNGVVTKYLYDGPNILLEVDQNGATLARYTFGPGVDRPLLMERSGQTYFYHADRIGSIAAVTDGAGSVKCVYSYAAFGRTQPCALSNPYGFAGREYDPESGLVYMRARYYDPSTGRFVSPDPLDLTGMLLLRQSGGAGGGFQRDPQQLNRYSYAIDNPLAFRDPSGLKCGSVQGPLEMRPFGDNGYSVARSLQHPSLDVVLAPNGSVVTEGPTVQEYPDTGEAVVSDRSGQTITFIGDVFRNPPYPGRSEAVRSPWMDINDALKPGDVAADATYAQIYNALLAYLDPLGNYPRVPDPLASPGGGH